MGCGASDQAANQVQVQNGNNNNNGRALARQPSKRILDSFETFEGLQESLRQKGLETSQLIVAIDVTKSNLWNGKRTFGGKCLHYPLLPRQAELYASVPGEGKEDDASSSLPMMEENPYQFVIRTIGKTLEAFDDDHMIPSFYFGDTVTKDRKVGPFSADPRGCHGFEQVLQAYNTVMPTLEMSGGTSFAPAIDKAIEIVKQTGEYHILLIVADGQIDDRKRDGEAIARASQYPISIITVGVGDGPWDAMEYFDDEIPDRAFDNFQFVDLNKVKSMVKGQNFPVEFALHCMMEVPEQYQYIKDAGLLHKYRR